MPFLNVIVNEKRDDLNKCEKEINEVNKIKVWTNFSTRTAEQGNVFGEDMFGKWLALQPLQSLLNVLTLTVMI